MHLFRNALLFFGLVLILFTTLIVSADKTGYKDSLLENKLKIDELCLDFIHSSKIVKVEYKPKEIDFDTRLKFVNKKDIEDAKKRAKSKSKGKKRIGIRSANMKYGSWSRFGIPFTLLFTLVVASFVSWKKKLISIVPILLTFYLITLSDLNIYLINAMQKQDFLRVFEKGSFGAGFIDFYIQHFPKFIDIMLFIAFFLWLTWLLVFTPAVKNLMNKFQA